MEASSSASSSRCTNNENKESASSLLDTKVAATSSDPWSISVKTVGGGIEVLSCRNGEREGEGEGEEIDPDGSPVGSGERQFTVKVSPDDNLDSLYDQIEASTGLKASQQRLIYRGRLIGAQPSTAPTPSPVAAAARPSGDKHNEPEDSQQTLTSNEEGANKPKIKDIAGLRDGHTIHLVKRRDTTPASGNASEGTSSAAGSGTRNRESALSQLEEALLIGTSDSSVSGGGSRGGLLAALLGLSSTSDGDDSNESANPARQRWGLRGSRMNAGSRSSRRPHYRITAEERQVPDPGSLEPVRQGMLTLHTMLPHLRSQESSPIASNREWYRGQWVDVLDTVNQWLEATVVEILDPEDILPPSSNNPAESSPASSSTSSRPRTRAPSLPCDPAVSASDLEGRRRLLLEPCDSDSDENDLGGELSGFRPRASNHGVQVLLIHYNGWPHRWDEWMRSDSERLRPFRTRTRHPNVVRLDNGMFFVCLFVCLFVCFLKSIFPLDAASDLVPIFPCLLLQSSTASPTPQSVFHESPRTNILPHGDDAEDRMALLPELARTVAAISDMLQQQVSVATGVAPASMGNASTSAAPAPSESPLMAPDLPWVTTSRPSVSVPADDLVEPREGEDTSNIIRPYEHTESDNDSKEEREDNASNSASSSGNSNASPAGPSPENPQYNQRELQNLATLLDRLGRTLTDAAPHVASLAANLPSNEEPESLATFPEDYLYDEAVEQALEEIAESMPGSDVSPTDTPIGGFLSLWSRERRRQSRTNNNTSSGTSRNTSSGTSRTNQTSLTSSSNASIDPDHEDYVSGLVNTTRGEVRSGPRSRSSNDDVANLLGAYLTAATLSGGSSGEGEDGGTGGLGQLLRGGNIGGGSVGLGGGGVGGIDIHIHAVLTTPGMPQGGVGITTLGGVGGTGGGTTIGGVGLGGTRNLFSNARFASSTSSILRSSRHSSGPLLSSRRRMQALDDEEDTGLFAELYSETPEPIDPNGSPAPGQRSSPRQGNMPNLGYYRDGDTSDYVTGLRSSYGGSNSFRRDVESPSDFLAHMNQNVSLDHTNVGAASMAGRSSTRRRSSRRSLRRETADDASSNASASSPRRSSGWGRLFRRRSSRES